MDFGGQMPYALEEGDDSYMQTANDAYNDYNFEGGSVVSYISTSCMCHHHRRSYQFHRNS